jgi:hypothetical protein
MVDEEILVSLERAAIHEAGHAATVFADGISKPVQEAFGIGQRRRAMDRDNLEEGSRRVEAELSVCCGLIMSTYLMCS